MSAKVRSRGTGPGSGPPPRWASGELHEAWAVAVLPDGTDGTDGTRDGTLQDAAVVVLPEDLEWGWSLK